MEENCQDNIQSEDSEGGNRVGDEIEGLEVEEIEMSDENEEEENEGNELSGGEEVEEERENEVEIVKAREPEQNVPKLKAASFKGVAAGKIQQLIGARL